MPKSYRFYAPEASFRAFPTLVAAEYNGIDIQVSTDLEAASRSPVGKLPLLECPDGSLIFSAAACARYVASLRPDSGLLGDTLADAAAVDAWIDWSSSDLELPACVWFYPVAGYMPFNEAAYDKAKKDLASGLEFLNDYLVDKTYLVGHQITLADVVIASALLYPFKLVADKQYVKPFGNVVRWFTTCVNQPEFVAVIGNVAMAKKELTAPGQKAPSSAGGGGDGKKGGGKKQEKKKKDKAAAPAPAPAPKKTEHPYKIMDKEAPSPFSMDAWKKTYSNCATYDDAFQVFWETFDPEGWSLWYQVYNYNEDNKRVFMTSNAVGGFQQRTDEIRRWAFGVMDVLGTEETVLEIRGVWLLRGQSTDQMIAANDDANWYTWTKLAGKDVPLTDETKKRVYDYWTAETELEGKPIQDSKVFK